MGGISKESNTENDTSQTAIEKITGTQPLRDTL